MDILKFFKLDFTKFVPGQKGYLEVSGELVNKFKLKFVDVKCPKVAINWHGNREGTRTFFNRSMPINKFEPIFEKYKDRIMFYSIQKDESHKEIEKYPFVVDMYNQIKTFEDTAAILKNCDLLISIDSSPVHMAGALNVPTYVMLPYSNEWRWFIDDKKSIWDDSVEIFRQNKEADWDSVIGKVLVELDGRF